MVSSAKFKWLMRCLLLALASHGAGIAPASADDVWKERFLNEAPKAWAEYREFAEHMRGTRRARLELEKKGVRNNTGKFVIDGPLARRGPSKSGRLQATNSDYAFVIRKNRDTGQWQLKRLERVGGPLGLAQEFRDDVRKYGAGGLRVYLGCWLDRMVKQDGFRLQDVEPVMRNGEQLARVTFFYEPPKEEWGHNPVRDGWVLLDPQRYWLLREAETKAYSMGQLGTITVRCEYDDGKAPFPILKRHVSTAKSTGLTPEGRKAGYKIGEASTFDIRFDMEPFHEADEADFKLSAYGLPEPPPPASKSGWNWWLTVTLAGLALLIIGILLYRRTARRKA